ncbi:MAG TPA: hypothetical protein VEK13_05915 [Thermoplasmata archaeon]|nr:hypothetical protein [Thermoplasmata archaeon]
MDPGLLERFRAAGAKITWRGAGGSPEPPTRRCARIAHLNDEEARVESWGRSPRGGVEVDSGPLGALVLLLEADRRGSVPILESREAGVDRSFPSGALRAEWSSRTRNVAGPTIHDVIELARYALA